MAELDEPLSDREQEVLELLAQGTTNKEIAATLFISPNTVKVHLRNINTKLGARSRTEASRIALERGIVVIPGMEPIEPPAEKEPEAEFKAELAEPIASPEPIELDPSALAETDIKTDPNIGANLSRTYMFGGLIVLAALLAVIAWFVFNPRVIEREPAASFEPADLGERWFTSRPLPESLSAVSAVAVGTDVFLIGGRQADGAINADLHVYDSAERVWRTAAPNPQPVVDGAAVALGGFIYIVGGETAEGEESDQVSVYIPTDDSWQQAANLPMPISEGVAITDGGQLFYLGGVSSGQTIPNAFLFDPATNSWSTLPDMPEKRSGAVGGVVNGVLYVIGGADENGDPTADCFQFSLTSMLWSHCTSMGNKRVNAGGVVILNKIYVIGGETGADFGELYNPASDIWEKIDQPMLAGLDTPIWSDAGVANVEAKVYVMGGKFNGTLSDDAYFFSPLVYQSFIPSASTEE